MYGDTLLSPAQVIIYLKWVLWLFHVVLAGKKFVVINMDETQVSRLTSSKLGYVASRPTQETRQMREHKPDKDSTDTKTTLLGTACNNGDLQPHLPQVLLPKYPGGKMPPRTVQELYTHLGYPIVTWHETCGSNTTHTMKEYLKLLRSVVTAFDPSLWIVLQLDDATCHLCEEVLREIRRLGMLVFFIPARLTWFLQLLDVYVYAWLKRELRCLYTAARIASASGLLNRTDWIPMLGTGIHKCLTHVDWSYGFRRVGIAFDAADYRDKLRKQVTGVVLHPQRPSNLDLRFLIHKAVPLDVKRSVDWEKLILGYADIVRALPADARPLPGAAYKLKPLSWTAAAPPGSITGVQKLAATVLTPMPPMSHLTALMALPPGTSVPCHAPEPAREGPSGHTRSQKRQLQPGLLDEERSATAASSTDAPPEGEASQSTRRRRVVLM